MQNKISLKEIISHAKKYGFIFPGSEIYDGLSSTYDYGPNGVVLKNKIKEYWWRAMVQLNENIVGLDAAILMHPRIWKASGHVDAFNDPMIDNKDSKKRYRADQLIEDYILKIEGKINKEVTKAEKKFGEVFNKEEFLSTNKRVVGYAKNKKEIEKQLVNYIEQDNMTGLKELIDQLEISCPISGSKNWTEVRQFNLMFSTELGSSTEDTNKIYLRPETAQGIFVNFLNVQKSSRMKIPFGIAQIGKAFRNEIIARQFVFRMKEFEQMEMQFFVKPGTEMEWYDKWKKNRMQWHLSLGFEQSNYRFHNHTNLAHYANAACDIEYNFPMGYKELEGIHSRTDFDLKQHQEYSGKKLQFYDNEEEKSYIPYVVETSIGLDRTFMAVFSAALKQEILEDNSERVILKIPYPLCPQQVAVLPLVNKDGLPKIASKIINELKMDFDTVLDVKDAIGRRYRRQDAIGTPFCITIDHKTLNDKTVTIRDRDTMKQKRVLMDELHHYISPKLDMKVLLQKNEIL